MPVFQINVWTCVWCGQCETTSQATSAWSDPVVIPPNGWKGLYAADGNTGGDTCTTCVPLLEAQGFHE